MKIAFFKFALVFVFMCTALASWATHNRAGEITYRHVEGTTYEVTITTCTKTSAPADRPRLFIAFGDEDVGQELDSLDRVDVDQIAGSDAQINTYIGVHTYPGPGLYVISVEDPNRNGDINNIPTSIEQTFFIQSELFINPFSGPNNSVQLLNSPKQSACLNSYWIHNPGAFDVDGDSLAYSLVPCRGLNGDFIPGYQFPDDETDDTSDDFFVDPVTGDVVWDVPKDVGEYNIAILVEEFRDGIKVGSVLRDMQIFISICNNQPPVIDPLSDYCVVEGNTLGFVVNAEDPDSNNFELTAVSAILDPGALVDNEGSFNPNTGQFNWQPLCPELRFQPYQVLFKAEDEGFPVPLLAIETVSIQVLASEVQDLNISNVTTQSLTLNWTEHRCEQSAAPDFETYLIYRGESGASIDQEECETGMPSDAGFELVGNVDADEEMNFVDEDAEPGKSYCYAVIAQWEDGSESKVSDIVCGQLLLEIPIVTKVSVLDTDPSNGSIEVNWIEPLDLDPDVFLPPYYFEVYHAEGLDFPTDLIHTTENFDTYNFPDLAFIHENIDTESTGHNYRVELFSQGVSTGVSIGSTSVFLTVEPSDNALTINFNFEVPWVNDVYTVFRLEAGVPTLLVTTSATSYTDTGLTNNEEYCYLVTSEGGYPSIPQANPVINDSQEVCGIPFDNVPPCPPALVGDADCERPSSLLEWSLGGDNCEEDITQFNLYYAPFTNSPYTLIGNYEYPEDDLSFLFGDEENIAGCWYVTALDSLNLWPDGSFVRNESAPSDTICLDNCPLYELPNIFSPNGDGFNDTFQPIESIFVDSVSFAIFNRWGEQIWTTTDKDLGWNGTREDSGSLVTDGTYYYTIRVFTRRLEGIVEENKAGYLTLVDGKKPSSE